MLLDTMATSRMSKLARETSMTAAKQEVEKGRVQGEMRVQISLSSLRTRMALDHHLPPTLLYSRSAFCSRCTQGVLNVCD